MSLSTSIVAAALAVCVPLAACVQEEAQQSAAIRLTTPDGAEHVEEGTLAELLESARRPLPPYRIDGVTTTASARLFTAGTIELPGAAGDSIVAYGDGSSLTTVASDSQPSITVTWDASLEHLVARLPDGELTATVEGVPERADRASVLGRLAIGFVGGDTGRAEEKSDFGITALIVLAISYVSCVTGGQYLCFEEAGKNCPYGVSASSMVCGAGFDVNGHFQLGMVCSYNCAEPAPQ